MCRSIWPPYQDSWQIGHLADEQVGRGQGRAGTLAELDHRQELGAFPAEFGGSVTTSFVLYAGRWLPVNSDDGLHSNAVPPTSNDDG